MRALIVEDDADIRLVIERALRQAGFDAVVAADGLTGDRYAAEGGFDVVIVDWNVPGLQGVEIVRRLREARDKTPVVLLTARDALKIASRVSTPAPTITSSSRSKSKNCWPASVLLCAGADRRLPRPSRKAALFWTCRPAVQTCAALPFP